MEPLWNAQLPKESEDKLMKRIEYNENTKLLDFGAGYGRYTDVFAKYLSKRNLYTAEVDERALGILRKKGYNISEHNSNSEELAFEDNFFDYIYSSNVVEHIPSEKYKKYLDEFYRVLKKGGVLIIATPNYPAKRFYDMFKAFKTKAYKYYFFDDPTHINKLNIYKFEKDLKKVFNDVKIHPTDIVFEKWFNCVKKNRHKLRLFADKVVATCKK